MTGSVRTCSLFIRVRVYGLLQSKHRPAWKMMMMMTTMMTIMMMTMMRAFTQSANTADVLYTYLNIYIYVCICISDRWKPMKIASTPIIIVLVTLYTRMNIHGLGYLYSEINWINANIYIYWDLFYSLFLQEDMIHRLISMEYAVEYGYFKGFRYVGW